MAEWFYMLLVVTRWPEWSKMHSHSLIRSLWLPHPLLFSLALSPVFQFVLLPCQICIPPLPSTWVTTVSPVIELPGHNISCCHSVAFMLASFGFSVWMSWGAGWIHQCWEDVGAWLYMYSYLTVKSIMLTYPPCILASCIGIHKSASSFSQYTEPNAITKTTNNTNRYYSTTLTLSHLH